MGKYSPLEKRLESAAESIVSMTFSDIEVLLQQPLPSSARREHAWWSNNATGHTQALAWLRAGFRTEQVDLQGETLVFRRVEKKPALAPIFGCLKETVTVAADTDLTAPALPEWAGLAHDPKLQND